MTELKARDLRRAQSSLSFLDPFFPKQYAAALDKAPFKAVNCTRRAGKTTGEVGEQLEEAVIKSPGTKHLFMALTLDSARNIAWDMIQEMLEKNKILNKSHRQTGEIFFGNGSYYKFFGVDASYQEMKKVLGGKYKTVKIDESGSMRNSLRTLCYQMIGPALVDQDGRLTLLGTAENIPKTFFEEVVTGKEQGWSVHKWLTIDNPYMREKWQKHLDWIDQNNPGFKETSEYKTHYLNEWCADDNLLIIRHQEGFNECNSKPSGELFYCLGVDLGFNDASSFTVCAFSRRDPHLYVLESFKRSGMDFTDVARTIRNLQGLYDFHKIIVDGSAKQGVEELRNRHSLPLVAAEKTDKETFLRALSDDYKQGRIKVVKEKSKQLIEEQSQLMWLKDANKEDPRCENHCNDSLLYAWRDCKNYMFEPEYSEWKSEEQKMKDQERREAEEMTRAQNESDLF